MKYVLGLDIGSTSLGWAIFDIEKEELVDAGVRIFDDGRENKTLKPLSVQRREARSARRLNKRHKMKMKSLVRKLTDIGLLPQDENERNKLKDLNPYKKMSSNDQNELEKIKTIKRMPLYALRANALDKKLELYEIGRILLQLGQRKGFLSNRKDNESTGGKLKRGNDKLSEEILLYNARTYGEYLYKKHLEQPEQPIRLKNAIKDNKLKEGIAFPYRKDYKDEFHKIWDKQKEFYPEILTDNNKETIEHILYWQRPLKEQEVGFCTFELDKRRLPKAHPLFQEFRILQDINNLKISNKNLTEKQRSDLLDHLMHPNKSDKTLSLDKIKKILKLKNISINYETTGDHTKEILFNSTEKAIKSICSVGFQNFWNGLPSNDKNNIVCSIVAPHTFFKSQGNNAYQKAKTIEKQNEVILRFIEETYKLDREIAEKLLYAPFEEGYCHMSEEAIMKLLPHMRNGSRYDEACSEAGYHHSTINSTNHRDSLPYYGEIIYNSCIGAKETPQNDEEKYGKISNVTVHVALKQVQLVVNELLKEYGEPSNLAIEYARDFSASTNERSRILKEQRNNKEKNDRIVKELEGKCGLNKISRDDVKKYNLLESQKWICVYCGRNFERNNLFNETDVDHILPFSRTFDDSIDNKVVCCSHCNRYKKNRTPYAAFSNQENWNEILERAEKLGKNKYWRFQENAMEAFEKRGGGLLGRSLNDTRYITKLLQQYLRPIMNPEGSQAVLSVRGQLTSMIRHAWGLNSYKDKSDLSNYRSQHQHHAIDAIIVSLINRAELNKLNEKIRKQAEVWHHSKVKDFVKEHIKIPGKLTPKDIYDLVSKINISHKPSLKNIKDIQSTVGQLHEETAYGRIDNDKIKTYVPKFYNNADRDAFFDAYKEWFILNCKSSKLKPSKKLNIQTKKHELTEREVAAEKKLQDCAQKAFKWHKSGNCYCVAIYEIQPNNTIEGLPANNGGDWVSEVVSNYNATIRTQRKECISYLPYRWPTAKKVMILKRNDMALATFTKEEIENLQDDDRIIENGQVTKKGTGSLYAPGLRSYLKNKIGSKDSIDVLFRVKKMDANGCITFIPHDVAKELSKDDTCWQTTDTKHFKSHNLRKVIISPAGKIKAVRDLVNIYKSKEVKFNFVNYLQQND